MEKSVQRSGRTGFWEILLTSLYLSIAPWNTRATQGEAKSYHMPWFAKDGLSWEHVVLWLYASWQDGLGDKLVFFIFSLSNYPNALGFGLNHTEV